MKPVYEFRTHMRSINLEESAIFVNVPVNKSRQPINKRPNRKAGVPIVIIESKSGVIRKVARTKSARESAKIMRMSLKSLNGLKGQTIQTPVVEVVKKSKPVKWSVTKVQKVMRLSEAGNKRVTMYKVTNTAGLKKYFVSHKAARLFVKTNR